MPDKFRCFNAFLESEDEEFVIFVCRSRLVGSPHRGEGGLEPCSALEDAFAGKPAPTGVLWRRRQKPISRQQKARIKRASCVVIWRSAFQMTEYGAADGTRTRDPRRDRPVF